MDDSHVVDDLAALVDGELDSSARAAVVAHLDRCRACRVALDAVRSSHARLQGWDLGPMAGADAARVRAAVLAAVPAASTPRRWSAWLGAAAAVLLVTTAATWQLGRPWIRLAPPAPDSPMTSFEREGRAAHLSYTGASRPDFLADPDDEAAAWAWLSARGAPATHLAVQRAATDVPRIGITGASVVTLGGARTSLLHYRIDDRPVTLALAAAVDVADAPGPGWWSKRVTSRHAGGLQSLTWTAGGTTYVLTAPADGPGPAACLICHHAPSFVRRIASMTAPVR